MSHEDETGLIGQIDGSALKTFGKAIMNVSRVHFRSRSKMATMETPVEEVRRLLETLSPETSFEDIHYHIYVQQAIRRGLDAAERGDLLEHEEVERRMAKWLGE